MSRPHPSYENLIYRARLDLQEAQEIEINVQEAHFSDETRARCAQEVQRAKTRLNTLIEAQRTLEAQTIAHDTEPEQLVA